MLLTTVTAETEGDVEIPLTRGLIPKLISLYMTVQRHSLKAIIEIIKDKYSDQTTIIYI